MECCALNRIIVYLDYQRSIAWTAHEMDLSVIDISQEYRRV